MSIVLAFPLNAVDIQILEVGEDLLGSALLNLEFTISVASSDTRQREVLRLVGGELLFFVLEVGTPNDQQHVQQVLDRNAACLFSAEKLPKLLKLGEIVGLRSHRMG